MLTRRSFNTLLAAATVSSMAPQVTKSQTGTKASTLFWFTACTRTDPVGSM